MKKLLLISVTIASIVTTSCKKCKECSMHVTNIDSTTYDQDLGKQCGDDLDHIENTDFIFPDGSKGKTTCK